MSAPHDRPSAAELIEAVREWVEGELVESTTGRLRFHARVAANALAIAERELQLGADHSRAHAERLAELGVADDAQLADAIRSGRLSIDDERLRAHLAAAVRDKLAVANPRYAGDDGAPPA